VNRSSTDNEIRKKWIRLNKEHHPDNLIAKGMPKEFIKQSNKELAAINIAYDKIKERLGVLKSRVKELKLKNINFDFDMKNKDQFDLVFCDVPCSGTGTWRRRPENIIWLKNEELEKLKLVQNNILFNAAKLCKIGGKIVARESIKGFKKDVLTKIHGGGATDRKRKLLEKQKRGKARSKQFGKVEIPQEAFIGVLKINKET